MWVMTIGISNGEKSMSDTSNYNLKSIKEVMNKLHKGKSYKVYEYETFYTAVIDDKKMMVQPILFSKKGGLPLLKTFAQMPADKCKNPKLIYGGK